MTLDLSLGEFTAVVAKALRGVGYPWGLATDGAHASRILAETDIGVSVGDLMLDFVRRVDEQPIGSLLVPNQSDPQQAQCPIALGAALADVGPGASARAPEAAPAELAELVGPNPVLQPVLLAPSLHAGAVIWDVGRIDVDDQGIQFTGVLPVGAVPIEVQRAARPRGSDTAADSDDQKKSRVHLDNNCYRDLLTFAGRIYVPASDGSRIMGAGAGTANDD